MKPQVIGYNLDSIPAELRSIHSWILWDHRLVKGEWTKVPTVADGSCRRAKSNDARTWKSFPDARKLSGTASGVGMIFTSSYCGIDLDNCRNRETGELTEWAKRIVQHIDSYTEASPSGEGVHIIVNLKSELPEGRRLRGGKKKVGWEIAAYDKNSPRYFAMTGVIIDGRSTIRVVDPAEFFPEFESGEFDPVPKVPKANGKPSVNGNANDAATVKMSSREKRERLMGGEWVGLFPSLSEADLCLVGLLAREYGDDPERIDEEFRKSGLMRDKWDKPLGHGTYGSHTIGRVLKRDEQKSAPKSGLATAVQLLQTFPEWKGVLGFNEFSQHVVACEPAPWQADAGKNWTDYDDSRTTLWLAERNVNIRTHITSEAVQIIARQSPFHPVKEYLNSILWDGEPRIERWLSTYLGAADTRWARAIGPRWLISAVARIFDPGCQADYAILLEGPQGIGKSSAVRILAGEWYTDHTSELGSKDSRLDLDGKWIIEFSELSAVRRSDIERVKAFITARVDCYRPPYGRRSESIPRSCVFAGTTNDDAPFTDPTGNRRFWPVRCEKIDLEALERDRDLLWAEAADLYKSDVPWWLDTNELSQLAKQEQKERYDEGVWDPIILPWVHSPQQRQEWDPIGKTHIPLLPFDSKPGKVTVTEVLLHAIGKSLDRMNQIDKNQVARCLIHAGWKRKQIREGDKRSWCYVRPDEDVTVVASTSPVSSPDVSD